MVDSVKNYGITGVSANVELGKSGNKIIGSDSSQISLTQSDGSTVLNAEISDGTEATHAVTKSQLDSITDPQIKMAKKTVSYNSGTISIGTFSANAFILSVSVEKTAGNWTNYSSATEITVGDSSDNDRLFSGFDPSGSQVHDETNHKYSAETEVNAYVTQGTASAGSATVAIYYSGQFEAS